MIISSEMAKRTDQGHICKLQREVNITIEEEIQVESWEALTFRRGKCLTGLAEPVGRDIRHPIKVPTTRDTSPPPTTPTLMTHHASSLAYEVSTAVTLVFGGCCTNAWSLERLLKDSSSVGTGTHFHSTTPPHVLT